MSAAFVIHPEDNVATALEMVEAGEIVTLLGEGDGRSCKATEAVRAEHKLALVPIPKGDAIVKYGMPVGHAVCAINVGDWVHLHNCASNYDKRSSTLDRESGAPTDIEYE